MSDVKISKPRLRVLVAPAAAGYPANDAGELVAIDVQTDNRDAVRFDLLRRVKRWPALDEAPMLWYTVLAWSAIKRAELAPLCELSPEKFIDDVCLDVIPIDEQGRPVKVDPITGEPVGEAGGVAVPTSAATDSG